MKSSVLFAIVLLLIGSAGAAIAGGPDQGFYIGGAGNLLMIDGTGDWGDAEIELDADFDDEDVIGFGWDNKMLFGIKPVVGYKINPQFAVQGGYNYYFTKSSDYSDTWSTVDEELTESLEVEWNQKSFEVVAIFYPSPDQNFFLYGGLESVTVEADLSASLEYSYYDYVWETWISETMSDTVTDDISATGLILGGGVEMPSGSGNMVTFLAAQYSTAKTNDKWFDTSSTLDIDEKMELKVGGFSAMFGMKFYMGTN